MSANAEGNNGQDSHNGGPRDDGTEFKAGKATRAWYREGVEKLVKVQQADGSFKLPGSYDGSQPIMRTACGLFLLGAPPKK